MTALTRPRIQRKIRRQSVLSDITIRDFSGGLNVADNDLNLTTKFATISQNVIRAVDGSLTIRPGTELFSDVVGYMDSIINMEYFRNHIIVVGNNGKVVRVDGLGNVVEIWSDDWADNLAGNPTGWDATTFCSFARYNGSLTIHNGINKPISVEPDLSVTYVQDRAIGTNAFTPVGRYSHTQGRYLVIAGDPDASSTIHISGTDTTTFVGDSLTDAVSIDLGSRVTVGEVEIKGIGSYRNQLVVVFEEMILPLTLGVFSGDDHSPTFGDEIEESGTISHRTLQSVGDDLLFADLNGVSSVRRAALTTSIKSEKFSHLIDPLLQTTFDNVVDSDDGILVAEDEVFSVFDTQAGNYMLFVPNEIGNITETVCYTFKKIDKLKIAAWTEWRDWNFKAACRSQLKRVFFADRKRPTLIWRMGEEHHKNVTDSNNISVDYKGYEETFSDGTAFIDGHGWTPVADIEKSGVPIRWTWELPWSDNDTRFNVKSSRYINFDTQGEGRFTCDMFVDNIYDDRQFLGETFSDGTLFTDSLGWIKESLVPTLTQSFALGDSPGFGRDQYGRLFGGGRPTRTEKLYDWSTTYKLFKLRLSGKAIKPMRIVSISLAYSTGSIRR